MRANVCLICTHEPNPAVMHLLRCLFMTTDPVVSPLAPCAIAFETDLPDELERFALQTFCSHYHMLIHRVS